MLLGVAAILLPYFFGTLAVMMLGAIVLASGILALFYINAARKAGIPGSVFAPWAQTIAGAILIIWPELALWIVAIIIGAGLILNGITGLATLSGSDLVNPPGIIKAWLWASIILGVLIIISGSTGSAILLGLILGVVFISNGIQQWRLAT